MWAEPLHLPRRIGDPDGALPLLALLALAPSPTNLADRPLDGVPVSWYRGIFEFRIRTRSHESVIEFPLEYVIGLYEILLGNSSQKF
jgi:hypothetical protein